MFFHFDYNRTLTLKGLFIDSNGNIRWQEIDPTPVDHTVNAYYAMYKHVIEAFEQKSMNSFTNLVSICFSGKLWENLIYTCETKNNDSVTPALDETGIVKAFSPSELCTWTDERYSGQEIKYKFTEEDRKSMACFLNETREKLDFHYENNNFVAYADGCYLLQDEDSSSLTYIADITYCPLPDAFKYCYLQGIKGDNNKWTFSYTTDLIFPDKTFIKTYEISPLLEDENERQKVYLHYLNNLGMLILNEEPFTNSKWITMIFSLRMKGLLT